MAKRIGYSLLTFLIMLIAIMLVSFSHATIASAAQAGATPKIYCTYTDENGVDVDGNKLTAGTYEINFVAEGFEKLSVVQLTATVSEGAAVNSIDSLLSDTSSDLASMGTVNSDGNLVFGFVPDTDNNGMSASGAVTLATVKMTFDSACDAADYISVSSNPNLTFVSTDYSIENNDEYALVDTFDGYNGALTLMECDVTPSMPSGHSVSANLVVMTDGTGNTDNVPVYGEYTVYVYSDEARTNLVTSVKSQNVVLGENKLNTFVIDGLADGTYYATVSSDYAITRDDVTIVVNGADISGQYIPIIACDFDGSGAVSALDLVPVYQEIAGSGGLHCDLDGSGAVSSLDLVVVYSLIAGGTNYSSITIK